ncbi:MAG TPA: MFS transporter [Methanospirillum sp.]|uniref:MFS transporter n=1 Tax=Methanospirillum sp. TaxID=45200 RepID=UPI002CD3D46E|nr:MFS transporter [Methanospirillum sp.]HWQ63477.1 MFS transporter [Methanospirillum sp.]
MTQLPGMVKKGVSPYNRTPRTLVLILGIAGFISAADNWFISPALPAIAADLGVSILSTGLILTAYLLPYGCMQPVFGLISDRIGKVRVLFWILAGFTIGSGACAMAGTLQALIVWRAFTGFFAAGIIAISLACLGDAIPPEERQHYVGIFMGIVFLGQGLSVGIGGLLTEFFSWRVPFMLFSAIAVCTLMFIHQIPQAKQSVSNLTVREELHEISHNPSSWILFPLAGASGFLLIGMYSYLGSFLHQIVGLGYTQIGAIVMFFGFSALIGGIQAGNINRRIGSRWMIAGGGFLASGTLLLFALFSGWQTGLVVSAGLGLGYVCIQSTIATLVFEISPRSKGLPSALVGLGLFGGAGIGTVCMGTLIEIFGYCESAIIYAAGVSGMILFTLAVPNLNPSREKAPGDGGHTKKLQEKPPQ